MATDTPDRFDTVDWSDWTGSTRLNLSLNATLFLLLGGPLILAGVYDWQFVPDRENVLTLAGNEFDPAALDYLFIFSLVVFGVYFVLPMAQNPRMTKYYWNEFKRNRPAVISLIWLLIVFVGGVLGPFLIKQPEQAVLNGYQPPVGTSIHIQYVPECVGAVEGDFCAGTWEYPLGTTRGGKGVFATIVYGMTISMKIAFITTLIVGIIGVSFGTVSAFSGGWVDELLMRFVDIVLSFPTFLFFLLILHIYGASLALFIIIFSVFGWGTTARYVRSKALSVSEEEFIDATRISGASRFRIVRRHVVPNTASSIITQLTLLVPGFILFETQLAFLGVGDSTLHSWGQLIATGRSDLAFAPWITLAPGIVLFLTILAFNFLGDALLDALNPEAEAEAEE